MLVDATSAVTAVADCCPAFPVAVLMSVAILANEVSTAVLKDSRNVGKYSCSSFIRCACIPTADVNLPNSSFVWTVMLLTSPLVSWISPFNATRSLLNEPISFFKAKTSPFNSLRAPFNSPISLLVAIISLDCACISPQDHSVRCARLLLPSPAILVSSALTE